MKVLFMQGSRGVLCLHSLYFEVLSARLDIRALRFTLAAEELSLTQSAISRQIKELELAIGTDLFRRVGRRVELTERGAGFAADVRLDLQRFSSTVFQAITA